MWFTRRLTKYKISIPTIKYTLGYSNTINCFFVKVYGILLTYIVKYSRNIICIYHNFFIIMVLFKKSASFNFQTKSCKTYIKIVLPMLHIILEF